ncbi:putative six-bladed beta-propeller -like protein [Rosellinia necatrix]|uniref:Putative six-bladed beta-propeller-like protein n=1 Tax=Rosellinia necatrix TaxID=77044 RepID=A0A1W2TJ72_ROSNE|nr:putative six-bladed beta-propeller -like protein [Rosellinia necatrix]
MVEEEVVLITQLPSESWFEGLVFRPNGNVLATRLDEPELYTFNPEDPNAVPQLVCTLPDCNSLINICTIPGCDDEYFILASTADLEVVTHQNVWLWRLTMASDDGIPPKTVRVVSVPDEGYCLGVKAVSDRFILLPDGKTQCIWHLDTQTGKKTLFAKDKSMERGAGDGFFGVNRLQIVDNFVYFTNSSEGNVCRIPVETDPSHDEIGIRAVGPVHTIIDTLSANLDGLAVSPDQTHAYVASHLDGYLHKVQIDPTTGKGKSHVIMTSIDNPTGVDLIPDPKDPEKLKLYIVCCGTIEVAWMTKPDKPWDDIRDINSVVKVVSQEVVQTST